MRTKEEINEQVKWLRENKHRIPVTNAFGDNHHDAIDAQIRVLEDEMDEDTVEHEFPYHDPETGEGYEDNVRENARQASDWLHDFNDVPPKEDW
jgi:hypothetical protein